MLMPIISAENPAPHREVPLHLAGDIDAQSIKQPRPRTVICIRTPIFFNFRRLNRKD